ncbi:uDP-N-acetylmuramoylalanine--D-glutamate ligase [Clostridium sp. CAG:921]|nr:uDP-N-acetylmuramoylalanine--D-glutamate ligase [Clostridium sp. CAG:921]
MKEKNVNSKIRLFSSKNSVENGAYFENGKIFEVENGMKKEVISVDDIAIKGEKNYLNICAAICAVKDIISIDDIVKTLKSFNGVEHRLEYVDTVFGVKYYNDSISTTPGKAMAALTSFDKKIILIAGGSDKNLDYTSLGDKIINSAKVLILLGATKNKIKKAVLDSKLYDSSKIKLEEVDSLEEAVLIASKISKSGDIVVMSPASASFDMFKNYKERGKLFKNLVNSLKNK